MPDRDPFLTNVGGKGPIYAKAGFSVRRPGGNFAYEAKLLFGGPFPIGNLQPNSGATWPWISKGSLQSEDSG